MYTKEPIPYHENISLYYIDYIDYNIVNTEIISTSLKASKVLLTDKTFEINHQQG